VAYLNEEEVYEAYDASTKEADLWRKDYSEYERLMDNGLLDVLEDDSLPEVNDGSLAASLFKMAKRVVKKKMGGRVTCFDRDDQWVTELANIEWKKRIFPNAKSKASPRRKWKDAARKAVGLGGQPIITLMVERGNYNGTDFIVPYAQDVKLEAGKDSDEDSDIIFWDIYYSKLQVRNMFEDALEEMGMMLKTDENGVEIIVPDPKVDQTTLDPYNQWNLEGLHDIVKELRSVDIADKRPGNQQSRQESEGDVKKTGVHFFIAFQRGEDAPFYMCRPEDAEGKSNGTWIRLWPNPDPTGDVPVHYLYMYQDFINPYGVGIVKLAGGTQNVLDYFRKMDILATQVGIRPPRLISGDEDEVDEESMVSAQDANWYIGNATVTPWNMANGVYNQIPARMSMYQTSLQKMIPMGDSAISGTDSGDPTVGRTPQALKMQAASLSVDDDDIAENIDECFAAVAKSMINTHFANMLGSDPIKLTKEEKEILSKSGIDFPEGSMELLIIWDNVRATFDFEYDPDADPDIPDDVALESELKAYEMIKEDPTIEQDLAKAGKRIDRGELLGDIFSKLTRNDKIIVDISPEEEEEAAANPQPQAQLDANGQPVDPNAPPAPDPSQPTPDHLIKADQLDHQKDMDLAKLELEHRKLDIAAQSAAAKAQTPAPGGQQPQSGAEAAQTPGKPDDAEEAAVQQIQQVMELYNVKPEVAAAMLEAEAQGFEPEEIVNHMEEQGLMPKRELAQIPEGEVVNA
jgi:hypothetical protein